MKEQNRYEQIELSEYEIDVSVWMMEHSEKHMFAIIRTFTRK